MVGSTKNLFEKLRAELGKKIVESGTLAKEGGLTLWLECEDLIETARKVRTMGFDWLIDIWCFEIDGVVVVNHVLKKGREGEVLILRISREPKSPTEKVSVPGLAALFPNASALERGCDDLFGVDFGPSSESSSVLLARVFGGTGFPMRKSYVFPTEFDGIRHERRLYESGVTDTHLPRIEDI